jgi:hypothetical protein
MSNPNRSWVPMGDALFTPAFRLNVFPWVDDDAPDEPDVSLIHASIPVMATGFAL